MARLGGQPRGVRYALGAGVVTLIVAVGVVVASGGSSDPPRRRPGVSVESAQDAAESEYVAALRTSTRQLSVRVDDDLLIGAGYVVCDYLDQYLEIGSGEVDLAVYKARNALEDPETYLPASGYDGILVVVWGVEYLCPQWRGARDSLLGPPELLG